MEAVIYLDTHVVAWLFTGRLKLLSSRAREVLQERRPTISPMVRLELEYLYEIGRVAATSAEVVGDLMRRIGLEICELPFRHHPGQFGELHSGSLRPRHRRPGSIA